MGADPRTGRVRLLTHTPPFPHHTPGPGSSTNAHKVACVFFSRFPPPKCKFGPLKKEWTAAERSE
eukprot:723324-Amphidinium_carterae.1